MKSFFLVFLFSLSVMAEFQVPPMSGPVIDERGVLRSGDFRDLTNTLKKFNDKGVAQVQVVILNTLDGMPIEEATIKIAEAYKLGTEKKDNGVVFLIAMQDKKIRIEVGHGLEGAIPDARAKRIVSDIVSPQFKQGNFSAGIRDGVGAILALADAEFDQSELNNDGALNGQAIFIGLFILFIILRLLMGSRSGFYMGGHSRGWGGGGTFGGGSGWSGGGGGSGWSGGGGSFGGGGASGDW